jgi:hypothetical protein
LERHVNHRAAYGEGLRRRGRTGAAAAAVVTSAPVAEADLAEADGLETTLEEIVGYQIVRAIVCSEVKPARVVQRDAKSYFAVLLDDNNRKPIARLHFNRTQKYIGIFDDNKKETRMPISSLEEIYEHIEPSVRA